MKLAHRPLTGGLLHLVQRGGDWAGPQPARPLLAIPITVGLLLYGPLLGGFNVGIKGLTNAYGIVNIVPGTAAIRRRRQSMKPQVEVKSMNHRPAADCAPCRRRRR